MTPHPTNLFELKPIGTSIGDVQRREAWRIKRMGYPAGASFGLSPLNLPNTFMGGPSPDRELSRLMTGALNMTVEFGSSTQYGPKSTAGDIKAKHPNAIKLDGVSGPHPGWTTMAMKISFKLDIGGIGSCFCVERGSCSPVNPDDSFKDVTKAKIAGAKVNYRDLHLALDLSHLSTTCDCGECNAHEHGGGYISSDTQTLNCDVGVEYIVPGTFRTDIWGRRADISEVLTKIFQLQMETAGCGEDIKAAALDMGSILDRVTCATHCQRV